MKLSLSIISILIFCSCVLSCQQDETVLPLINESFGECNSTIPLYSNLSGNDLENQLRNCFTPLLSRSYEEARNLLYSEIDVENGMVQCIYSGYEVRVDPNNNESFIDAAFDEGVNCEHSYPQSLGASEEPERSDMFHIYPARENVNQARSNLPYAEINDEQTQRWFYLDQQSSSIPNFNIDNWTEGTSTAWEPREEIKGDIARGIFYFKLIYVNKADVDFFEGMKETLLRWHIDDPVDQREQNRNNKIKQYQGNDNPFIIDASLAERVFGN